MFLPPPTPSTSWLPFFSPVFQSIGKITDKSSFFVKFFQVASRRMRSSLLNLWSRPTSISLQSPVGAYITAALCRNLPHGVTSRLRRFALRMCGKPKFGADSFLGSRPNSIEGKNVRPSVRPYVRSSTKSFFNLNEIWYIGIGRWLLQDDMPYGRIEGQGHEPFKVW